MATKKFWDELIQEVEKMSDKEFLDIVNDLGGFEAFEIEGNIIEYRFDSNPSKEILGSVQKSLEEVRKNQKEVATALKRANDRFLTNEYGFENGLNVHNVIKPSHEKNYLEYREKNANTVSTALSFITAA